jgi:outer membrane protein OmpA-like peptidoglycan-associated protein
MYSVTILALALAAAPACASKKFVRTEVGSVNDKITPLSASLEETQERTRQNETKIGAVDAKAEAAARSATEARAAGDSATAAARQVGGRVDTVATEVATVATASRKLVFEVTLSEDQGNFKSGGAALPDETSARLDALVTQLKADPKGNFIEIAGYTDNIGTAAFNEQLGRDRAEAVKRYLYDQHQVPLHKINVTSYGEANPVAPNNTRAGRAQNRRVVVRVLS